MKNRVTVSINNHEYTLIANEDEAFVKKVADYVNVKIIEIVEAAKLSNTDAAVLAAANIAEEYFKALETSENLRGQLKGYLEEAAHAKAEISELRREISALKKK